MFTRTLLPIALLAACGQSAEPPAPETAPKAETAAEAKTPTKAKAAKPGDKQRERAAGIFGVLPDEAPNAKNPLTDAKIDLGRALYYDARLSSTGTQSCNSCHNLDTFGVDNEATSPGAKGERGGRNSPTVYNAALHGTQFWDGRSPDVEDQAKGPILNPIEMGMPDSETVMATLKGIEGYPELFAAAFEGEADPMSYDNLGRAIGAFERRLVTPGPLDAWLAGDDAAMSAEQLAGMEAFLDAGCVTCHTGPALGGAVFMKLGLVKPYESEDQGRFEVTGNEADRQVFKVPGLRNIAETGPYLHDGSVADLESVITLMATHQLGRDLDQEQVGSIKVFLEALTGTPDAAYIKKPKLPGEG